MSAPKWDGLILAWNGALAHFGGLLTSDQNETFLSLCLCYLETSGEKKNFFFAAQHQFLRAFKM